jgi:hypothetical protein
VEGKSSPFVLSHIRASQADFRREIEAAGFEPDPDFKGPKLKENFVARFRKSDDSNRQKAHPPSGGQSGRSATAGE